MVNTPLNLQTQGKDTTQTIAETLPFTQTSEMKSPLTSKPGLNTFLTGAQWVNRQVAVLGGQVEYPFVHPCRRRMVAS